MEEDPAPEKQPSPPQAKVLEGALDFFRRSLPRIVVFDELGPRTGGSEPASIRTLQDAVLKTHDFVAISPGCEQPVLEKLRLA